MYDAQQGSTSGAHIDMSTASGTNVIHGTGYVHRGTNWLNAAPFFFKQDQDISADNEKSAAASLQPAVPLGGPIIKDKLFGFLAYQHVHVSDQEIGISHLDVPVGSHRRSQRRGTGRPSADNNFGSRSSAASDRSDRRCLFNSPALQANPASG